MTVTGITASGEHLQFERWAYEAYVRGNIERDVFLLAQFQRCVRFILGY